MNPSFQRRPNGSGRRALVAVWQEGPLLPSWSRAWPGLGTGPRLLVRNQSEIRKEGIHKSMNFHRFRLRLTRLLGIGQSTDAKRATVEEERDGGNGATDKSAKLSNGGAPQAAPEEDEDAEEEENHK